MELSIVATLYRSAPHIEEFYQRSSAAARKLTESYEIILVNDGSPDNSLEIAVALVDRDPHVRVVDLSRNFGHHKAMMTGLEHARGKQVFLIDCDLEEEPELLLRFDQEKKQARADVVYGVQEVRKGGFVERMGGKVFFFLFNLMSTDTIPANIVTARLMSRRYVDSLLLHREREILIGGLWAITGYHQVPVMIVKRHKGSTTYSFGRRLNYFVNGIISFSNKPLVYVFYLGCAIILLSLLAVLYLIIRRVFYGVYLGGWPSLIVSIWMLGGLTIFCLGIVGVYLSKIFSETKQRPYTIVREIYEQG